MASERAKAESLSVAEHNRLIAENSRLRQQLRERNGLSNIVGTSRPMRLVCDQIGQVAPAGAHVLLQGEPGTGKTLIARAIHHNSSRATQPFITMQCSGASEGAVDAQVFGEPRGGLGIAGAPQTGSLQRAAGGTLFLEEVGALGLPTQDRLLSVVKGRALKRRGGGRVPTDVRLIGATSANLDDAVAAGRFRADFYEQLSVFTIVVPPLRDRKADVPMLVDLLVEKFAREHARRVVGLSMRAMDMLMGYDWPGNVRELSAVIERAVVLATGPVIHHHTLPMTIQDAARSGFAAPLGLAEALDSYEEELLRDALKQTRGVRSKAARLLRTTERIFNYKLRKHRIDSREFKVTG